MVVFVLLLLLLLLLHQQAETEAGGVEALEVRLAARCVMHTSRHHSTRIYISCTLQHCKPKVANSCRHDVRSKKVQLKSQVLTCALSRSPAAKWSGQCKRPTQCKRLSCD
jgi:hypothetical protein